MMAMSLSLFLWLVLERRVGQHLRQQSRPGLAAPCLPEPTAAEFHQQAPFSHDKDHMDHTKHCSTTGCVYKTDKVALLNDHGCYSPCPVLDPCKSDSCEIESI